MKDKLIWILIAPLMLAMFLLVGCEQGRTSVGTGGGPVQVSDTAIEPPTATAQPFFPQQISGQPTGPRSCPVFNPVTGALVCSCASLAAGEC